MADRPQSRPDRVISTVDTQARHTRKSRSKRRDGFRGHVAAEAETELITDCEMTMAAGDGSTDADNDVKMACRDRFHGGSTAADGEGPAAAPGSGAHPEPGPEPQPEPEPDDAGAQAQADGLEVRGFSLRQRGGPRRLPGGQARHHHQAWAAARGRARRVHPGFTHAGTVMAPALERHPGHRHSDTPTRSQTDIQR